MARPEKEAAVAELKQRIQENEVAILTKYVGVTVAQVTELRKRFREAGVDFKVYKNTLATIALRELGLDRAAGFMEGPTAWAFSKDPVVPAKILKDFHKQVDAVAMSGGIVSGRVVGQAQLQALADLPSIDQLRAQVVGVIAMPLRNLVGALSALPRNLANVVDQIRKQKEEGAQAA
ncbi:MAG: 50S ribosomal protein L10 [Candidatus Hydrogenedentes bacterium]|nr:50S ribosomal protein L10 [Candidatus Hydrogenedentota bacterium]